MVIITNTEHVQAKGSKKKSVIVCALVGVTCLLLSLLMVFIDPILMYINFSFHLTKGSHIYHIFANRMEGARFYLYLYNYTNPKEFLAGQDWKLKLSEVGPFVYQEYRTNEDIEIDTEAGTMSFSPKQWTEFIPEESVGDPKSVHVITPNLPVLPLVSALSTYPFFIKGMINMYTARVKFQPLINRTIQDILWGYSDPLLTIANAALPGLLNFDTFGLMNRFQDNVTEYRMEVGISGASRFSIKKIKKKLKDKSGAVTEYTSTYSDTYEGAVFPPHLGPEMPINIISHSVCQTFRLQYAGSQLMNYGAEANIYIFHNSTFSEHRLCDGKGWCPDGFKSLASCFVAFPVGISKSHFLDGDPRLLERIEGFKPDRSTDETIFIIDPILGATMTSILSLQLNILMGNVEYNHETRIFKNIPLPIIRAVGKHPHMLEVEAKRAAQILYIYGPCMVIILQIVLVTIGVGILLYQVSVYLFSHKKFSITKNSTSEQGGHDQPLMSAGTGQRNPPIGVHKKKSPNINLSIRFQ